MTGASRVAFPDGLLVPERGWLSGFARSGRGRRASPRGEYTAIVPLAPFLLPDGHPGAGGREETSLQFASLPLPAARAADLAGASCGAAGAAWPVAGEMHVAGSYVPLGLRRISFGPLRDGAIEAVLELSLDFEDELGGADSGFLSREATLGVVLELDGEPALLPAYSLLGGAYRPTTGSIMFVECPAERFVEWLAGWLRGTVPRVAVDARRLNGTLADALPPLAP